LLHAGMSVSSDAPNRKLQVVLRFAGYFRNMNYHSVTCSVSQFSSLEFEGGS